MRSQIECPLRWNRGCGEKGCRFRDEGAPVCAAVATREVLENELPHFGLGREASDEVSAHVAVLPGERCIIAAILTFADHRRRSSEPRDEIVPFPCSRLDSEIGQVGEGFTRCFGEEAVPEFRERERSASGEDLGFVGYFGINETFHPGTGDEIDLLEGTGIDILTGDLDDAIG